MTGTLRKTMTRTIARAVTAVIIAMMMTFSASARAEPLGARVVGVDWARVLVQLDDIVRTGHPLPRDAPVNAHHKHATVVSNEDPDPRNMGNAWFGAAPRVTLVARDWASSTRLAGDRLSVIDAVRLAASTRMVVGRARLSDARFTPFFQAGLGQWRVDRNYLPLTPHNIEVAAQFGGGFEMRLRRDWQVACEATGTSLMREGGGPMTGVPHLFLWSTLLASRIEF